MDNVEPLIPEIEAKRRLNLIYGDLGDAHSLDVAIQKSEPDYIFHLAAQSDPQTHFTSPVSTLETNVLGNAVTSVMRNVISIV